MEFSMEPTEPTEPPKRRRTRAENFWWDTENDEPRIGAIALAVTVVIVVVGFLIALPTAIARCGPGEVCVVRNGGPLDSKDIRTTMTPGGGYEAVGFWSQIRHYRSSDNQSQYRITTNPEDSDKGGVDFVEVPTKDGVQVRLQATTFFTTAFTGEDDDRLVREFDERFGNRTYGGQHVWDDEAGYREWQDAVFRPLLNNAIRSVILTFDCEDLISSCALVRSSQSSGDILKLTEGRDNSRNFERVGEAIAERLRNNIRESLRSGESEDTFLTNIRFNLEDVNLPGPLQQQINAAQQANAKIAESRAEERASILDARKNRRLAASYRRSRELKEVRVAEIYARSRNPHLVIVQGNGTPLVNTP